MLDDIVLPRDLYALGGASFTFIAAFLGLRAWRAWKQARRARETPTSPCGLIRAGPTEVKGKVELQEATRAPISGIQCAGWTVTVRGYSEGWKWHEPPKSKKTSYFGRRGRWSRFKESELSIELGSIRPFFVADHTGKVLVKTDLENVEGMPEFDKQYGCVTGAEPARSGWGSEKVYDPYLGFNLPESVQKVIIDKKGSVPRMHTVEVTEMILPADKAVFVLGEGVPGAIPEIRGSSENPCIVSGESEEGFIGRRESDITMKSALGLACGVAAVVLFYYWHVEARASGLYLPKHTPQQAGLTSEPLFK